MKSRYLTVSFLGTLCTALVLTYFGLSYNILTYMLLLAIFLAVPSYKGVIIAVVHRNEKLADILMGVVLALTTYFFIATAILARIFQ